MNQMESDMVASMLVELEGCMRYPIPREEIIDVVSCAQQL